MIAAVAQADEGVVDGQAGKGEVTCFTPAGEGVIYIEKDVGPKVMMVPFCTMFS